MDKSIKAAEDEFMAGVSIPASDDTAVAWIMYQSLDYSVQYCVGNKYDPTDMTLGIVADNAEITGEETYTVRSRISRIAVLQGECFSRLSGFPTARSSSRVILSLLMRLR